MDHILFFMSLVRGNRVSLSKLYLNKILSELYAIVFLWWFIYFIAFAPP